MECGVWGRINVASGKESLSSELSWSFLLKELVIKARERSERIHTELKWLVEVLCSRVVRRRYCKGE